MLAAGTLTLTPERKIPAILYDGAALQGFQILFDIGPFKAVFYYSDMISTLPVYVRLYSK